MTAYTKGNSIEDDVKYKYSEIIRYLIPIYINQPEITRTMCICLHQDLTLTEYRDIVPNNTKHSMG